MSLTGSHKNQFQSRCTEQSPSLPASFLSSSRPFHNKTLCPQLQHSLSTQQRLHSLTTDLQIFKPSLHLSFSAPHFSASTTLDPSIAKKAEGAFKGSLVLPHLELQKPKRRNPRLSTLNTTFNEVSHVAHLSHLQLVNPSRHCGSAEEKFVNPHLPIFQRYPRPEKECQSFSLLYNERSLDLICKDKDEAESWFSGLKALISRSHHRKWRTESRSDEIPSEASCPRTYTRRSSPLYSPCGSNESL